MAVAKPMLRCFAGLLFTIALTGFSGEALAALTPEQALDYTRAGDLHLSPDGKKLAYIELSYPLDWKPRVRIMDLATGATNEITPAKKSERSPRWSPDGKSLAFLSNRGEHMQVYVMSADGGDATALTSAKNGVSSYRWSPDGKSIAYLAEDDDAPQEGDGPQVADDERNLDRLWVIDVATKQARKIGITGTRIDEIAWQDASHLLIVATDKPRIEEFDAKVFHVAVSDGTIEFIARPPQPTEGLFVSPDGKQFAVESTRAKGPEPHDLFVGSTDGKNLHDATAALDREVTQVQWHGNDAIWFVAAEGFETHIYKLANGKTEAIKLPQSATSFDVAQDGTIVFAGSDFALGSEIYLRAPDGSIRQLTHMQSASLLAALSPVAVFKTKSFDGQMIEAALVRPANVGGKLPLVLLVHGGPSSRFSAGYDWEEAWAQMLASHGYQVLMVNPRGSTGYSEAFLKANHGDWGGGDYKDLMAVLNAVIARGQTDPNRLGIGGWSYGGEMSEWAITQSNRFKAAVVGAGVFDQAAEFETEQDPAGDEWYFGNPWQNARMFARNSPSTYIARARTPALIFDGEDDKNNPVGQSKGLYRALKHFGVETELVLYPNEGHSPKKGSYNIDMFQRLLDWYDEHLKK